MCGVCVCVCVSVQFVVLICLGSLLLRFGDIAGSAAVVVGIAWCAMTWFFVVLMLLC